MARVNYVRRRRAKKASAVKGVWTPRVDAAQMQKEQKALREDRKRAFTERGLLEDTKLRTTSITARRHRELAFLFRRKDKLPESRANREDDDLKRRYAVVELMEARVAEGIEHPTETLLWAGLGTDITNGLRRKLAEYFDSVKHRRSQKKSQRRFLEWSLRQPQRSGIPLERVDWLRQIINQSVGPAEDINMEARMRAVYYILACARSIGVVHDAEFSEGLGKYSLQYHQWLVTKPREFFEDPGFSLNHTYPLDLDIDNLIDWAKESSGGPSNATLVKNDSSDETDSDDMQGLDHDSEGDQEDLDAVIEEDLSRETERVLVLGGEPSRSTTTFSLPIRSRPAQPPAQALMAPEPVFAGPPEPVSDNEL